MCGYPLPYLPEVRFPTYTILNYQNDYTELLILEEGLQTIPEFLELDILYE
jgi:hypothetical protein